MINKELTELEKKSLKEYIKSDLKTPTHNCSDGSNGFGKTTNGVIRRKSNKILGPKSNLPNDWRERILK